jgi:hypothetical protein
LSHFAPHGRKAQSWRTKEAGRTEHRVEQQAVPVRNVVRELGVKELGQRRLLVSLDENLAYPDGAARRESVRSCCTDKPFTQAIGVTAKA